MAFEVRAWSPLEWVRYACLTFALLVSVFLTVVPPGSGAYFSVYDISAVIVTIPFVWAVLVMPKDKRTPWLLLLVSQILTVVGDVAYNIIYASANAEATASFSNAVFALSYAFRVFGLVSLARRRHPKGKDDWIAWIDVALITFALLAIVVVLWANPISLSPDTDPSDRLAFISTPIIDVMTVGLLLRLGMTAKRTEPALMLFLAGQFMILLADLFHNYYFHVLGLTFPPGYIHAIWIVGYAFIAFAASRKDAAYVATPTASSGTESNASMFGWFGFAAGVALLVPVLSVFVKTSSGDIDLFAVADTVVVILVILRAAILLKTVKSQADELAELARVDGLTGLPNRRTWDFEVNRATTLSTVHGTSLWVAILDLDHFKDYNDTNGHTSGDELLVSAAERWKRVLPPGGFLARYGGEEFGVLLSGQTPAEALVVLNRMRLETPSRQTLSIGVAEWQRDETPLDTLRRADLALYEAKKTGRDRVLMHRVGVDTLFVDADGNPVTPSESVEGDENTGVRSEHERRWRLR